ncbi:GntR family transcriptional regulator [Kordiimonas sp. SCSIO 12610]|uniref:GntR family transcriptional regulator n=1 Tax=Kordiimonas sp. SCSIO 12610 TaxID=2829597 RepID=UPI00210E182C|nr:GntR family transcriptional regulator [Kordiimonas sp. SCSIO 12610]UTW54757.1 GntR family transcriptional regulator [Kordiimonas sp. SCSIO 12610]
MPNQRALPKHIQLSEMLIREIMSGQLANGSRLPSERQMAADLGVAIGTLRKALAILQEKGALERIHGSGNYIRSTADINSIYSFFRLELLEGGGLPTAKVIDVQKLKKPIGSPDFGAASKAHRIRRIRFLNDKPIAIEEIWLDASVAKVLEKMDLIDSLYLFYKENLGLVISRVEDQVGIDILPDWNLSETNMEPGSYMGYIERVSWDTEDKPVEFSKTWFNSEIARYTMRLQ